MARRRLLERSFDAPCALEAAWARLARLDDWPSWARHIRQIDVAPAGPLGPATSGVIRLANGLRSRFTMTAFEPLRRWEWSGPFLGLAIHYDHRFDAIGADVTRLTWTVAAEGRLAALLGPLFAAIYARQLDRAIARLQGSWPPAAAPQPA